MIPAHVHESVGSEQSESLSLGVTPDVLEEFAIEIESQSYYYMPVPFLSGDDMRREHLRDIESGEDEHGTSPPPAKSHGYRGGAEECMLTMNWRVYVFRQVST